MTTIKKTSAPRPMIARPLLPTTWMLLMLGAVWAACGGDDASTANNAPGADMARPSADMRQPDMTRPGPDMRQPDMRQPDMRQPDMRQPDMSQPDMRQPDMNVPDMRQPDMTPPDMGSPLEPTYQGSSPLYQPGELMVEVKAAAGAPAPTTIYAPVQGGQYPVVVFQHGFLMATGHYGAMLRHIASHGFIVVAPQMYDAGGFPIGKPNTDQEAALAVQVLTWARASLQAQVPGRTARLDRLGMVGHSRGSKVIWKVIKGGQQAQALVGLDPVDGTGGPLGGDPRVLSGQVNHTIPTLIVGTGLGPIDGGLLQPACAPQGDNYVQFYGAARSPAYQVVLTEHGHLDMLDDNPSPCGRECTICPAGPSRAPARAASAGLIVALMRAELQGVASARAQLTSPSGVLVAFMAQHR